MGWSGNQNLVKLLVLFLLRGKRIFLRFETVLITVFMENILRTNNYTIEVIFFSLSKNIQKILPSKRSSDVVDFIMFSSKLSQVHWIASGYATRIQNGNKKTRFYCESLIETFSIKIFFL